MGVWEGRVSVGANPTHNMGTFIKSLSAYFSIFKEIEFDFQLLDQHGEDGGGGGVVVRDRGGFIQGGGGVV